MKRLFHALAICLIAVAASPASAQNQSAITLDIRAGYEGSYRSSEWFPVVVNVANDGPDLNGVLEWSFPAQRAEPVFRAAVDLPRGSRKRVTIEAFSRGFARSGQLQLVSNGAVLAEQTIRLDPVDSDRFLIGVASSDAGLLNSLNSLQFNSTTNAVVRHFDLTTIPEHAAALRGINALVLHDVETAALNDAQRAALELWVRMGGQLVVSGGINAQRTAAGLDTLLPVTVSSSIMSGSIKPLANLGGMALPGETENIPMVAIQPRQGAIPVGGLDGLLYQGRYGNGTVAFSTFDLAVLRGWGGEVPLWDILLDAWPFFSPGVDARQNQYNLLQEVLHLPALGLPSSQALLLFLGAYILMVGPLNYLVLRRLRRMEWAWLTVPATVIVFAVGLYLVGFGLRGGQSQLNQVAVVQSFEGYSRGMATSFLGLFSPRRASYTLMFPADALVAESRVGDEGPGAPAPILKTDAGVEVADLLVDIASVRTLVVESPVDLPLNVQSSLQLNGNILNGEIQNTGSIALENVLVVQGVVFQDLGTLAPGTTRQVDFANAPHSFPWGVQLPENGLFNRKQFLESVFRGSASDANINANPDVYLIAWVNEPVIQVRLDGQQQSHSGLTLYVIRLKA